MASNINVSYSGVAVYMHGTVIQELGPYDCVLNIGSSQSVVFKEEDILLFWMNKRTHLYMNYDIVLESLSSKDKTKAKLLVYLWIAGFNTTT